MPTCVSFDSACRIIKQGGVVAVPTETVYGLAGSVFCEEALKKIFHIKKRPLFNPLIVHCSSIEDMKPFHNVQSSFLNKIVARFSPGPLTLVLSKSPKVRALITAGQKKVALRIPCHPLTLRLIKHTGALSAPSANMSGQLSPTRPEHVERAFKGQVPILDGGACEGGIESTVIEPDFKNKVLNILRPGLVSKEDLKKWLKKEQLKGWNIRSCGSTLSPGQLKKHYQPTRPLVVIECSSSENPTQKEVEQRLKLSKYPFYALNKGIQSPFQRKKGPPPPQHIVFKALNLNRSPTLSARLLYHELNLLSQNPSHIIYVIKRGRQQRGGAWSAIWNRLHKASSCKIKWNHLLTKSVYR